MTTTKHSDKALKTLALLGTVPSDWKQTDIRWVDEVREVVREATCPVCYGARRVAVDPETKQPHVIPAEIASNFYRRESFLRAQKTTYISCENCVAKFGRHRGYSTGKVPALVKVTVYVGYPIWPEGTKFDSRFRSSETNRYCCQLCSKSLKSYQVPVVGRDSDGQVHGMWVGTDCAKKFLGGLQIRTPEVAKKKGLDVVMDEAA